jgi:hypothetical protein
MRRTGPRPYPPGMPGRRSGRLRAGRSVADETIAFCEKCGRDRDVFRSTPDAFRVCPRCGAACCPDCWNQVGGGCLACIPFSLPAAVPPRSLSPLRGSAPVQAGDDGLVIRRATPRPAARPAAPLAGAATASGRDRPTGTPAAGATPAPAAVRARPSGHRMVRFAAGVTLGGLVLVGLSAATYAAAWPQGPRPAVAAVPSSPAASQDVVAVTPAPAATPAATVRPHPARTAAPASARPVVRATSRPAAPRRSEAPAVIVAPPAPKPTPKPTPVAPTDPPPPTDPPQESTPEPPAEQPPEPTTP